MEQTGLPSLLLYVPPVWRPLTGLVSFSPKIYMPTDLVKTCPGRPGHMSPTLVQTATTLLVYGRDKKKKTPRTVMAVRSYGAGFLT